MSKFLGAKNKIFVALEYRNPSGSIKDRVVLNILKEALRKGKLRHGMLVTEATSGNTGIALAYWSNIFKLRARIYMPKGMSNERKTMISLLGAEVVEVNGDFEKAIELAREDAKKNNGFYLGQFEREENPLAYKELARKFADLGIDYFVAGVGTGGTLIGFANVLRKLGTKIIAVYPKEREHGIQGIGDWVKSKFFDQNLVDKVELISTEKAIKHMHMLWRLGFLVGRSSGANIAISLKYAELGGVGTVFPDSWDRYLSLEKIK